MTKGMEGNVALVTGGASGIGKVTAQFFAREGAKVVVSTGTNVKGAEETVELIEREGGDAVFIKCDVADSEQVEALINRTVEYYGSLDYAYNNAGIGPDGKRSPNTMISDTPEDAWDHMIDINLKGVFLCMKYEIRQMLKQKKGAIVNCSSVGAFKAIPGFGTYSASKTGILGLTRTAALEYATSGIRINAICPGPTAHTSIVANLESLNPEASEKTIELIPMGRMGEPEDMAEAVIWLCSDAASFITGHIMPIDGGMTSQ